MTKMTKWIGGLAAVVVQGLAAGAVYAQSGTYIAEAYPDHIQARRERQERQLYRLATKSQAPGARHLVVESARTWRPGQTLRVAFNGGTPAQQQRIVEAAEIWAQFANIRFDWGATANGGFRRWTAQDTSYAAHIRIAFWAGPSGGYWSLVGTESVDSEVIGVNEPSMNLEGFDDGWPIDGEATVLHEFGHALGLHHEHQHPDQGCDSEFLWHNEAGYQPKRDSNGVFIPDDDERRPGLYTHLGGPPNEWSKFKVDYNLRQFEDSRAFDTGQFDPASIMMYSFEPWMFINGIDSYCYTPPNETLSDQDKLRVAQVYPGQAPVILQNLRQRKIRLDAMIDATRNPNMKEFLTERLAEIQQQE